MGVWGKAKDTNVTFRILFWANVRQLTYGPNERLPVRFNSEPASAPNLRVSMTWFVCRTRFRVMVKRRRGKFCYLTMSHAFSEFRLRKLGKAPIEGVEMKVTGMVSA